MLAFAGGILGVLMMVPLRRALIVKGHGVLPYPEGTACADVLVAASAAAAGLHGIRQARYRGLDRSVVGLQHLPDRTRLLHAARRPVSNATLNVDISPE
jgi:uncharacterized oligopeptide transporter (OPT) family protein